MTRSLKRRGKEKRASLIGIAFLRAQSSSKFKQNTFSELLHSTDFWIYRNEIQIFPSTIFLFHRCQILSIPEKKRTSKTLRLSLFSKSFRELSTFVDELVSQCSRKSASNSFRFVISSSERRSILSQNFSLRDLPTMSYSIKIYFVQFAYLQLMRNRYSAVCG